jgi:hypothetical protein
LIEPNKGGGYLEKFYKYPRTQHLTGSKVQTGDEDLSVVSFLSILDKYVVVGEKIDGANVGISFVNGELKLQSRGHYLAGGYREKHFSLLKNWATAFSSELYSVLGERYVMYGEWLYAKHTVFYDRLPHYFFEFDILDKETRDFFSTDKRRELLAPLPFIQSVPVLKEGYVESLDALKKYLGKSLYKSESWRQSLRSVCEKYRLDFDLVMKQTDDSDLAEGLYLKIEADGKVTGRCKFVRGEFTAAILNSDSHWLERPIIPNLLEKGEMEWTL